MAHDPSAPRPSEGIGEKPPTAEEAHREYLARQDSATSGELGSHAVPIARAVSDADYDLAWDMAHASKEERYKAAEKRAAAVSRQAEYERRGRRPEDRLLWKEGVHRHTKEAERFDEDADRIDGWVEFLRDHPIPEEYMSSHNVTARGLAAIEKNILDLQEQIDEKLQALDSTPLVGVHGFDIGWRLGVPVNLIARAFGAVPKAGAVDAGGGEILLTCSLDKFDREAEIAIRFYDAKPDGVQKLKAYREAVENPETTLGQLRDMYAEAYDREYLEPLRRKIEVNHEILDAIRNGQFTTVS